MIGIKAIADRKIESTYLIEHHINGGAGSRFWTVNKNGVTGENWSGALPQTVNAELYKIHGSKTNNTNKELKIKKNFTVNYCLISMKERSEEKAKKYHPKKRADTRRHEKPVPAPACPLAPKLFSGKRLVVGTGKQTLI